MGRYGNPNMAIRKLLLAWNSGKVTMNPNGGDARNPQNRSVGGSRRRNSTPLADTQVDTMRTLRNQGMGITSLAERFGVHRSTIWEKTRQL